MEVDLIMFWLILLIVLLVVEAATLGLTTIWFAAGALIAGLLALIGLPIWLQLLAFFVISLVLLIFTRPIAVKYFNKDRVRTNVESLVGKQGVVLEQIDNLKAEGQVLVSGQEWSARSVKEDQIIQKGAVVEIVAISGVKLIVEELAKEEVPEDKAASNVEALQAQA